MCVEMRSGFNSQRFLKSNFWSKKQMMFKVGLGGGCKSTTVTSKFNLSLSLFCSTYPAASSDMRTTWGCGMQNHTGTGSPYLCELPTCLNQRRETGGEERESQSDDNECPALHWELGVGTGLLPTRPLGPWLAG